jgi:hypothetical protein
MFKMLFSNVSSPAAALGEKQNGLSPSSGRLVYAFSAQDSIRKSVVFTC